ncbi:MAG: endonuclease III [Victivallaceae bacterium]
MNSSCFDKKLFILNTLEKLFPSPKPSLTYTNGFQLLIAVLLSGNSSDKIVNKVTPHLFEKAPDAHALARLTVSDIAKIIKPCGLSERKATFISIISRILSESNTSDIPDKLEDLTALPGVGRKTALVTLAQWFDQQGFPIDTHIIRLAQRWGLSLHKSPLKVERDLTAFFLGHDFIKLHLRLIYYGRLFCPARGHKLSCCIICRKINDFQ